jgi:hypothetical protein
VVDARAPGDVVALALHGDAADGEVDAELAADQEHERGSLLVSGPFRSLLPGGVDAPFDFERAGRPRGAGGGVDEVPEEPAPVLARVVAGVAGVPVVSHLPLQLYRGQVHAVAADLAKAADGLAEGEQAFIAPGRIFYQLR